MRPLLRTLAVAGLVAVLSSSATAWISTTNRRIDRVLHPEHDTKLVLTATIRSHDVEPDEDGAEVRLHPPRSSVRLVVEQVLLGAGTRPGDTVRYSTQTFDWPVDLLPLATGTKCIVLVDPERDDEIGGTLQTVLPWRGAELPVARDSRHAQQIIGTELAGQVDDGASATVTRELVRLLAPLIDAERATRTLTPLLEHDDLWVRRSAIGALAYAAPTNENLQRAVSEIEAFAAETAPDAMFGDIQPGSRFAAYPYFLRDYQWLQTTWSESERARLASHLVVHRAVARTFTRRPAQQWSHGLQPLCTIGDESDLRLFYEFYVQPDPNAATGVQHRIRARVEVLRRMAELTDVAWSAEERYDDQGRLTGLVGADAQLEAIEVALRERGADWLR